MAIVKYGNWGGGGGGGGGGGLEYLASIHAIGQAISKPKKPAEIYGRLNMSSLMRSVARAIMRREIVQGYVSRTVGLLAAFIVS